MSNDNAPAENPASIAPNCLPAAAFAKEGGEIPLSRPMLTTRGINGLQKIIPAGTRQQQNPLPGNYLQTQNCQSITPIRFIIFLKTL
jgi:hypothetical protein